MIILVAVVHIVVSAFLIAVVLLQHGKSADIAATFGGQGSQAAFGPRGAATLLSKLTTWSAVLFMLTSFTLSVLVHNRSNASGSVMENVKPSQAQPTPTPQPPSK